MTPQVTLPFLNMTPPPQKKKKKEKEKKQSRVGK